MHYITEREAVCVDNATTFHVPVIKKSFFVRHWHDFRKICIPPRYLHSDKNTHESRNIFSNISMREEWNIESHLFPEKIGNFLYWIINKSNFDINVN